VLVATHTAHASAKSRRTRCKAMPPPMRRESAGAFAADCAISSWNGRWGHGSLRSNVRELRPIGQPLLLSAPHAHRHRRRSQGSFLKACNHISLTVWSLTARATDNVPLPVAPPPLIHYGRSCSSASGIR
jgi:hypothetical protein